MGDVLSDKKYCNDTSILNLGEGIRTLESRFGQPSVPKKKTKIKNNSNLCIFCNEPYVAQNNQLITNINY